MMTANKQTWDKTKLVEVANHRERVIPTKTINTHLVATFTSECGGEYNSDDS